MLGMRDAALIGISTPLGSDNWLSAAIKLKDENGVPYFPVIQIGLVCQKCLETGSTDVMDQCEHMKGLTPPWKAEERAERARRIIAALDDPARAFRENAGVVVDSNKKVFDQQILKDWFSKIPTYETCHVPDRIYMTVDPDAGGETSCCAIVSGYRLKTISDTDYPKMTFVILGLESKSTKDHIAQEVLVINHIKRLRSNQLYQHVPIIFIPESNTGFQHTHLDHAVGKEINCYTLYFKNGPTPGVRKDARLTASYMEATQDIIYNRGFVLDTKWFSVYGFKDNSKVKLLDEFKDQLMRYGYDEKEKLTGKFGVFKDDITIAFMMIVYWSRVLERPLESNPYQTFIQGIEADQKSLNHKTTIKSRLISVQNIQPRSYLLEDRQVQPTSSTTTGKRSYYDFAMNDTD